MSTRTSRAAASGRNLPEDSRVQFAPLLDVDYVRSVLEQNRPTTEIYTLEVGHIRYSPGKSCTVSYEVECSSPTTGERVTKRLYAKCRNSDGFAKAAKNAGRREWLEGVVCATPLVIPELNGVLYEFPNDAKLESLALLAEPAKLAAALSGRLARLIPNSRNARPDSLEVHPLRYKPESRFVARCESHWIHKREADARERLSFVLRFDRGVDGDFVFGLMRRLGQALRDEAVGIPRPLFAIADLQVFAVERLEGEKLSDVISGTTAREAVARAARALAVLHRQRDSLLPRHPPAKHLQRIDKTAAAVQACGEEFASRANVLQKALVDLSERSTAARGGFVHGDFHQGQVLLEDEKTHILDFDRCFNGETIADVGSFLAQLELLQVRNRLPEAASLGESFLQAYQKASGGDMVEERLRLWTVTALADLAAREFRRLKPNWPDAVGTILDRCLDIVDG